MWYVYFLELRNGDLYVGSTDDLRRRFNSDLVALAIKD